MTYAQSNDAQSIDIGDTRLTPSIRVDYVSIDNLFRDATDEVSATGLIIKPTLSWQADKRTLAMEAYYSGDYGFYSEDEADYNDHALGFKTSADLSSRQRMTASFGVTRDHEEQGEDQTANVTERLDEQIIETIVSAQAEYTYGARNARGNLQAGLLVRDFSYSNLEQFTDGDDYLAVRPYGIFTLRVSQDTRLLAELRFETLDFDDDRRDRNEISLLTGMLFTGTGKLSGSARIGTVSTQFDNLESSDSTELVAEVGLDYRPLRHSLINLYYLRNIETLNASATDAGESIVDYARLGWTHEWSERLKSTASLRMTSYDYECPTNDYTVFGGGLELNLQVRRWLEVGVSASQSSKDQDSCSGSTIDDGANDYDRGVLGVHFRGTL